MKLLLRFYPQAWRERYGAELEMLLRDEGLTLGRAADVVRAGLQLRWADWWGIAIDDLRRGLEVFRQLRPVQKFAAAMALLGALTGALRSRGGFGGVAFAVLVVSVLGLNLMAQARNDRSGSRARRALAVLIFAALSIDAVIYLASWGTVRASTSKWIMQPILLAILPQTRPWPVPDRGWSLRLGSLFCALQTAGFCVGAAVGWFGAAPAAIGMAVFAGLVLMLERERRALVASASPL